VTSSSAVIAGGSTVRLIKPIPSLNNYHIKFIENCDLAELGHANFRILRHETKRIHQCRNQWLGSPWFDQGIYQKDLNRTDDEHVIKQAEYNALVTKRPTVFRKH
jgi:hypothetical protein